MTQRITIISPELPPTRGGLADYTHQVVAHWPGAQEFEFVAPANRTELTAKLPSDGGAVLLQYSAYGFHRLGYPHWLLNALVEWKRATGGRLCVMFHEIWTFWPWWNKNAIVQLLHRRAIARLVRAADAVFTTTVSQAAHLSALATDCDIRVLPVGANIFPRDAITQSREPGTATLFGMASTRLRALREMAGSLRDLARTQRLNRIVVVGGGDAAGERGLLESLDLAAGFQQLGGKSAEEISAILATAEFGIAAQDPLSYTKSSTFMAYAAHGLNILSNYADAAAPEPTCLLTSPAELSLGIDGRELEERGGKLRAWYERTASWPRIAEEFAKALRARN